MQNNRLPKLAHLCYPKRIPEVWEDQYSDGLTSFKTSRHYTSLEAPNP